MIEDEAIALLALLKERDGMSLSVVAKRLGLGQSELRRLLTALGSEPGLPGLGLVDVTHLEGRSFVWLTPQGKVACGAAPDAAAPPTPDTYEVDELPPAPAPLDLELAGDDDEIELQFVGSAEADELADSVSFDAPGAAPEVVEASPAPRAPTPAPAASRPVRATAPVAYDTLPLVRGWRLEGEYEQTHEDAVIAEMPVAFAYNGLAFAVMLATPADLEDFALGFSLSEGIVNEAGEWRLLERVDSEAGICLDMAIPQARMDALESRKRHLAGRSGCGACGLETLQAALPPAPRVAAGRAVPVADIRKALAELAQSQPLNARSGGVHAAAFAHAGGLLVREDVGRHNALDKVIGARARAGLGDGFLVVTSRASYELVHKAATAGIGLLVAISAPTSLAIRVAGEAGITLVAFARGEAMNVYSHPDGIV